MKDCQNRRLDEDEKLTSAIPMAGQNMLVPAKVFEMIINDTMKEGQ